MRADEPVCFVPALDMWLVTRWDDVVHIEAHPELFTAATEPSFLARALGQNMLTMDPPEHTRLQSILAPPFQPGGRSGAFASNELGGLADGLIDQLDPAGFDVMADYAQPLSAASLATVLGLDHHGYTTMWHWCEGLCTDLANFENDPALAAIGERAKNELGVAIGERLADASDDGSAISSFVAAGASATEVVNNVRLMISGGINEPRDGIGLVTWVLLTRPDLRSEIDADRRLLRRLIEEVFRVYSPVGTVTRQTTADVEIAGTTLPAGALVAGVLRSINLDEDHWNEPTQIDLHRREGTHAAFGLGAHRCLGEWLGRQEVRVGVERLLDRFPDLELAPSASVELAGFEFRGPRSLYVRSGGSRDHSYIART
jgi:cytochrome P450